MFQESQHTPPRRNAKARTRTRQTTFSLRVRRWFQPAALGPKISCKIGLRAKYRWMRPGDEPPPLKSQTNKIEAYENENSSGGRSDRPRCVVGSSGCVLFLRSAAARGGCAGVCCSARGGRVSGLWSCVPPGICFSTRIRLVSRLLVRGCWRALLGARRLALWLRARRIRWLGPWRVWRVGAWRRTRWRASLSSHSGQILGFGSEELGKKKEDRRNACPSFFMPKTPPV